MDQRWARPWHAVTAVCVLAGVLINFVLAAQSSTAFGGSGAGQAFNIFAFFTIQSNLIVGVTTLLLALDPDRTSMLFRVARLTGLVAITVTFVVFHVALSHLLDLDTWGQTANQLVHTVVPILAIAGWLMFGPRGQTSATVAKLTTVFPLAYMVFTLIRGPLASDWYPYPFADVAELGYLRVAINAMWIALLFVGVAAVATAVDRRLDPKPDGSAPAGAGDT